VLPISPLDQPPRHRGLDKATPNGRSNSVRYTPNLKAHGKPFLVAMTRLMHLPASRRDRPDIHARVLISESFAQQSFNLAEECADNH